MTEREIDKKEIEAIYWSSKEIVKYYEEKYEEELLGEVDNDLE